MKTLKRTILLIAIFSLASFISQAQGNQMYRIHTDDVKPAMAMEYESIVQELVSLVKKHNIAGPGWNTQRTNDSKYYYISPINNMGEIEDMTWAELSEKAGREVVTDLFRRMDKCYDNERNQVIIFNEELSYLADANTAIPEDNNYRKNYFLYITPENRAVVKEKMKAVKSMFERKGAKEYYRVYNSGFGSDGEFYLVSIPAKNAEELAKLVTETNLLLGSEGEKILGELFGSLLKYTEIDGQMRPDLAYIPKIK